MKKILLWLDDIRNPMEDKWLNFSPIDNRYLTDIVWVKNYKEFVDYINNNGIPDAVCFDHDLGLLSYVDGKEMTGYDCAKYLIEYCINNNLKFPQYNIQSANPIGKDNINGIIRNFIKHVG